MGPHLTVGEIITPAKQKTLQERFLIALEAIYHAEKALLRSPRKMARSGSVVRAPANRTQVT